MTEPWWISLLKAAVIVNLIMVAFAYTTWLERKLLGRMQNRYGPNRVGPFGLIQPPRGPRPMPTAAAVPTWLACVGGLRATIIAGGC